MSWVRIGIYLVLFGDDCVVLLLVTEHLDALRQNSVKGGRMVAELQIVLAAP